MVGYSRGGEPGFGRVCPLRGKINGYELSKIEQQEVVVLYV